MGWARFDDRRAMNAKLRKVGFAAAGLDAAAICQSVADMSDGHVDRSTVEMLAAAHGEKRWLPLVEKLVAAGRWVPNGDGWHIHDFLEYNPSRAEWLAEKAKKREAGRAGGLAKAEADALARAMANGVAVPSPSRPDPIETSLKSHVVTHDGNANGQETGTGASHSGTGTNLPLGAQIAQICHGRNRGLVNLEAAAVVAWASPTVGSQIIEEAIGWFETQDHPPNLPRAVAAVIATKAADHAIGIAPFRPPSVKRRHELD